jgi:dienelactone hydrolase
MTPSMLLLLPLILSAGENEAPRSDVGNYWPFLDAYAAQSQSPLSYLSGNWNDPETWRAQGRAKMRELLAYEPQAATQDAEILETVQKPGCTRYLVRYSITSDRKADAFLLIPDGLTKPAPAVLALHCHGGYYYFGKEKAVEIENPPKVLQEFLEKSYGGRPFADELARRGFVVLAPDAFYFGSQRLDPAQLPDRFTMALRQEEPGSDAYIRAFNNLAGQHEHLTAKTIFDAGTTWPGILFQGDRASVDYLLTRPEVDPARIGCMGLSIGGYRSAHLFGLDPRLKAAVVAGWMTTYRSLLFDHLYNHTWMVYVPGQLAWLDLPDVATLNAPQPLMVINCRRDTLFTMEGMQAAEAKIAAVYEKLGARDHFRCNYYNEPHSLKIPAQDDAIAWLEKWLKE